MKTQASFVLLAAAFAGLANAGFIVDDGKVSSICGDINAERACFTVTDPTNINFTGAGGSFAGYITSDHSCKIWYSPG